MKRSLGAILIVFLLMCAGLGIYFLMELYRPFEARVSRPKNLVLEYSGPGAIKNSDVPESSNEQDAEKNDSSTK